MRIVPSAAAVGAATIAPSASDGDRGDRVRAGRSGPALPRDAGPGRPRGGVPAPMVSMAESGRRRIGERTREAMAELKARGVESGTPDDLTPDARLKGARDAAVASKARAMEEMSDVAAIAAAMGARGLSPRDIADRLNADGYL